MCTNEHDRARPKARVGADEREDKQMEGKVGVHLCRGQAYVQHQGGGSSNDGSSSTTAAAGTGVAAGTAVA